MKRRMLLFFSLLLILSANAFAHSGRTDSSGGHTNSSTGEYHYHHGYEAHQHLNGQCPYDLKDVTNNSATDNVATDSSFSSGSASKNDNKSTIGLTSDEQYIAVYMGIGVLMTIIYTVYDLIKNKKHNHISEPVSFGSVICAIFICCLVLLIILIVYWTIYQFFYEIGESIFGDDNIITHMIANAPSCFLVYFFIKESKS